MAKIDLRKTVKGLTFFTKGLPFFGTKRVAGDQFVFDQRGAIRITDKEVRNRNGEIIKIRGVEDAGRGNPMVISRPGGGTSIDSSRAMEANHGWPYAAIKAIADEIAGIEWVLCKVKNNGDHEEVQEHEVLDFLETVNDFQTGPEFKHIMVSHLELTGNAYIYLEGVTDVMSKPKAMYLLDPSRVKVVIDKTTFPFKIFEYEFIIENTTKRFKPWQIVHLKWPNPSNQFVGLGTVAGIAEWIDNDNNTTEFLRQFYKNGAQIGVTFETDMTSEEQLQAMRDSFEEQHAGVGNAYKGIFLPKGVTKATNDVKFDDVGFDETANTNRDKILAGFRVSKTILGAAESETNRATAETADYVFARRTIKPKMQLICSYLNEFLVPRFGDDIYLTFNDPVPEDRAARSAEMKNAIGGLSVLTIDEAREEYLGLGPVEGGDALLAPNNYVPAKDAGTIDYSSYMANAPKGTEKEKTEKSVMKPKQKVGYRPQRVGAKTQFSRNVKKRAELSKELAENVEKILKSIAQKSLKEMTRDEYDSVVLKAKRDRTQEFANKMNRELKKINDDQRDEVLANISEIAKSQKDINPSDLFDVRKWIAIVINALTPIAREQFKVEAEDALRLIDRPGLDVAGSAAAREAITSAMSLMAESYNLNTIQILQSKLNEGLRLGYGVDKMRTLVQDIYEFKDKYAAERVALTESNRIANDAGKIAWKESGVVKELQWITSNRDVCPFCDAMEGTTIPINQNFFDRGEVFSIGDGQAMNLDYSDIGGPPLHPNCHCGMRPIIDTSITAGVKDAEEIDVAIEELKSLDHESE